MEQIACPFQRILFCASNTLKSERAAFIYRIENEDFSEREKRKGIFLREVYRDAYIINGSAWSSCYLTVYEKRTLAAISELIFITKRTRNVCRGLIKNMDFR